VSPDARPGRETLDALLAWSPAQPIMRRRHRGSLATLTYHAVTHPDRFARHLDVLASTTNPVSLDDVVATVVDGAALPPSAVLVTFDDGDPSILDVAAPMLHERGIPAILFVVTDLVGTDAMLWPEEVEHLVAHGGATRHAVGDGRAVVRALKQVPDAVRREAIDELRRTAREPTGRSRQLTVEDLRTLESLNVAIGSHTASHPCLPNCDDATIEDEVTRSRARLAEVLGSPPAAFAYPNGDHDARAVAAVAAAGYTVGFVFDHRLSDVPPKDPHAISRVRINDAASVHRVRIATSGLHSAVHRSLGRH
jgi:peptidoglycan/xylan/chitin deacetylase (PgdA/CDA1 family)